MGCICGGVAACGWGAASILVSAWGCPAGRPSSPPAAASAAASTFSPALPTAAMGLPTGTAVPSETKCLSTTPLYCDSTSTVALSVSISASSSPFSTLSPSFLAQRTRVPSAISKPSLGMVIMSTKVASRGCWTSHFHVASRLSYKKELIHYSTSFTAATTSGTCGRAACSMLRLYGRGSSFWATRLIGASA